MGGPLPAPVAAHQDQVARERSAGSRVPQDAEECGCRARDAL